MFHMKQIQLLPKGSRSGEEDKVPIGTMFHVKQKKGGPSGVTL